MADGHAGAEAGRRPDGEQPRRPPDSTSLVGAVERMSADVSALARAEAASSDDLGERLAALEFATGTVAADIRLLVERVGPLPDCVAAMAAQIDRITPLARSAGDAGSLLGQLDRVGTRLEQVLSHLGGDALASGPPARPEGLDEVVKFQAVVDMLAGVIRRQDQVATAVASVLDQLNGPTSVVTAITRTAQRERTVDLPLDRIDAGPAARSESRAVEVTRTDDDRISAAVTKALELQEEAFAGRLNRLDTTVRALADQSRPATPVPGPTLESVLQRLDQQEQAISRRLEFVGDRLAEVAVHLVAAEEPAEQTGLASGVVERLDAVRDAVTGLSRHQEALTANVTRLVAQIPPPPDPSASAAAARRLEELRNERVRVQVRLQEERLLAAQGWSDDPLDEDLDNRAAPL